MVRPDIKDILTGSELKRWYWLKQELVDHCKATNLTYDGSKFDILDQIADALDNPSEKPTQPKISKKSISKFNWHTETLSLDTIISDNYKNTQNVRHFFIEHLGNKFHFSIPLMDFMKISIGKTLQNAVNEWQRLNKQSKDKKFKSEIPEGNQYNRYVRDFFADNPNMTVEQARHFWKLKRRLPLGRHIYEKTDLNLK